MPRYKHSDAQDGQGLFLVVDLKAQLLAGTFEHMLNELVSTKIDVSAFDQNYRNDHTGASAIPPEALLKLALYGYRNGHISSRSLERLNQDNITAKALTGDMPIHFTTIAKFISGNAEKVRGIFTKVLLYCHELELIGGDDYAVDGARLPSNASLGMSGTKEELEGRVKAYQQIAEKHLARHEQSDAAGEVDAAARERFAGKQKHLQRQIGKIESFLKTMEPKKGYGESELKSNVTDNDSAMIYSPKGGTIQGYIGQAAVDGKSQVIVGAQAIGAANEAGHLASMLDIVEENIKAACGEAVWENPKKAVLGDGVYFSEGNLRACAERGIDAVIPDSQERQRFNAAGERMYEAADFTHHEGEGAEGEGELECPRGKRLEHKGETKLGGGGEVYQASASDCRECPDLSRCSRSKKPPGQLTHGKKVILRESNKPGSHCLQAREKMAAEGYKEKYARRIGIVEPVFASVAYCKGLSRFTLRGKAKVSAQWQLYCIVHNLGKCLNALNERKHA